MVSVVDRTPYRIFGKVREVEDVSYTLLKGVDKKVYLNWVLVNDSDKKVRVNFTINPDDRAFKYKKSVVLSPKNSLDHKLVVNVEKLSDEWEGVLVLSAEDEVKEIPMYFKKNKPVH